MKIEILIFGAQKLLFIVANSKTQGENYRKRKVVHTPSHFRCPKLNSNANCPILHLETDSP